MSSGVGGGSIRAKSIANGCILHEQQKNHAHSILTMVMTDVQRNLTNAKRDEIPTMRQARLYPLRSSPATLYTSRRGDLGPGCLWFSLIDWRACAASHCKGAGSCPPFGRIYRTSILGHGAPFACPPPKLRRHKPEGAKKTQSWKPPVATNKIMTTNGGSYQKVPAVDASIYEAIPNGTSHDGSGKRTWIAGAAVLAALAVAYGCYAWQPSDTAAIESIGKSIMSSTSSKKGSTKLKLFDDIGTCNFAAADFVERPVRVPSHTTFCLWQCAYTLRSVCHGRLRLSLYLFFLPSWSGGLLWQARLGLLRQPWSRNLYLWY
jgi:hypothetical protein